MSNKPNDGPATTFEPDPFIEELLLCQETHTSPTFSMVLVAGWPPDESFQGPYNAFIEKVKGCFDPSDIAGTTEEQIPSTYLYPFPCLHITVATLHSHLLRTTYEETRRHLVDQWKKVILGASRRNQWPTKPLKVKILRAQIGGKAGILLWDELTGRLESIRQCIALEVKEREVDLTSADVDVGTISIPAIVHSTFLRFRCIPRSNGDEVQEKFQQNVLPFLEQCFPSEFEIRTIKLVCERRPYMHIPCDDEHVFAHFTLQD